MAGQTVWIVQRIDWEYSDEYFYRNGDTPLKAFRKRAAAEAHRLELERAARAEIIEAPPVVQNGNDEYRSPWYYNLDYTFGNLTDLTSLSLDEFVSRAKAIGLPDFPPIMLSTEVSSFAHIWDDEEESDAWWYQAWETLKPDRTDLLWDILDRLHFFQVVEVEVEG